MAVLERIALPDLGHVYRLEGYPGFHEESTLARVSVEELQQHVEFKLDPPLDVETLRSKELFAYGIGEIVQIDDVDDEEDPMPVAYRYGIISAMGIDADGLYYVVGLQNEDGEFVDSKFEFAEDELIRLTHDEQEARLRCQVTGNHLTLASSR